MDSINQIDSDKPFNIIEANLTAYRRQIKVLSEPTEAEKKVIV